MVSNIILKHTEPTQKTFKENPYITDLQYQLDVLNMIYGTNHTVDDVLSQPTINDILKDQHIPDIYE